jgi:hypothetical protein
MASSTKNYSFLVPLVVDSGGELISHAAENDPDRQVVKESQKHLDRREGE